MKLNQFFTDQSRWAQGTSAIFDRYDVPPEQRKIVRACLLGAFEACGGNKKDFPNFHLNLIHVIKKLFPNFEPAPGNRNHFVSQFNDFVDKKNPKIGTKFEDIAAICNDPEFLY